MAAPGVVGQAATSVLDLYDLRPSAAVRHEVPRELEEISGLAVAPSGALFAHDDERAVIYELDPRSGSIRKRFFLGRAGGIRGDFEGIAIAGERFFVAESDGTLYEFREAADGEIVRYQRTRTGIGNRCEVEGLAFDPRTNALLLACKSTSGAQLRGHIVVLGFSLDTMRLEPQARLRIPLSELEAFGLRDSFHASGIELHPAGTLFLVAARDEVILEATREGRILQAHRLGRAHHPQTEGIAFLHDGSLVLADEAQPNRPGSVALYPLRAATRARP